MNRLGILFSRMRKEEKILIEKAEKKRIELIHIDTRKIIMGEKFETELDVIIDREISHNLSLYAIRYFESLGLSSVNSFKIASRCGDKVYTTLILDKANIPNLKTKMAFSAENALETIESMGYPCVIKPPVGSWGRMIAKINDREAAEAIVEQKTFMPGNSIYYIQEYINKPGRDIRVFCIDGESICAIYRNAEHWITNTARGGKATNCKINNEISSLCESTSKAIGDGLLAIDLIETDNGLKVNEVNHKMEFRNSIDVTGVDIPMLMLDYAIKQMKGHN